MISVNAILNTVGDTLKNDGQLKNRPIKGFIQIFQVIFSCVVVIVVVSILIDKSPVNLITGLGAFTAVLMLVFKDPILGLVAGVMISENDMLRIGDWLESPERPQRHRDRHLADGHQSPEFRQYDRHRTSVLAGLRIVRQLAGHERFGRTPHHARIRAQTRLLKPCTPEFLER